MNETCHSGDIRVELTESDSIEEIVLAFRKDGELHELAHLKLPAEGILRKR